MRLNPPSGQFSRIMLTVNYSAPRSTFIYFGEDIRATLTDLYIYIGSVPTEHLDSLDLKLKESLRRIVKEGVDLERMTRVINREERQVRLERYGAQIISYIYPQLRSKLEADGGDALTMSILTDFLYGKPDGSQIESAVDEIKQYAELRTWTSKQWTDLFQK